MVVLNPLSQPRLCQQRLRLVQVDLVEGHPLLFGESPELHGRRKRAEQLRMALRRRLDDLIAVDGVADREAHLLLVERLPLVVDHQVIEADLQRLVGGEVLLVLDQIVVPVVLQHRMVNAVRAQPRDDLRLLGNHPHHHVVEIGPSLDEVARVLLELHLRIGDPLLQDEGSGPTGYLAQVAVRLHGLLVDNPAPLRVRHVGEKACIGLVKVKRDRVLVDGLHALDGREVHLARRLLLETGIGEH